MHAERGSWWILRFLVAAIRKLGSAPLRPLVPVVALYFVFFGGKARRASRDYMERMRGLSADLPGPIFGQTYRHLRTFAFVILDRLELWSGAIGRFQIRLHGEQCMRELIEHKRGAMLVGAHLGSFDVLRLIAREYGIQVNVIMYTGNAELINRAFEELDPSASVRLIELDPHAFSTALEIRKCVNRGEFVAMLGDRVHPSATGRRKVRLNFLGQPADFAQGPFLMAAILGIPLIMSIALRRGFREYDGYLTLISEGGRVPRSKRQELVGRWSAEYVALLEGYCMRAPLQWFNFYDFWGRE
ncbi:MAG: hypothetical protein CBC48_14770 [bacterium TMED88]|nr:hypothetical protein [Deltaproteobacteria bacterium]OUV26951.1 MAG: hypothetical protein CBC48_14770 [bacterium TMED88]